MVHRKRRRAIIISIYGVMVFALIWFIVDAFRPAPSCSDGKRNQNEIGIDCGGVCKPCPVKISAEPLKIDSAYVVDGVDNRVDAVAQITNPNPLFGAHSVQYVFRLKDKDGAIVAERKGSTFILPSETKYVIELGIRGSDNARIVSADFTITDVVWQSFNSYQEPRIVVLNKTYSVVHSDTAYSRVTGLIRNESGFDFASIYVNVVLKDQNGVPVAVHRTRLDTIDSGMEREFSLPWPQRFSGDVATVDVDIEANVFDVDNYRRKYISD